MHLPARLADVRAHRDSRATPSEFRLKILVLAVGRPDRERFGPLFDDYAERVRRFGLCPSAAFADDAFHQPRLRGILAPPLSDGP